MRLLDEMFVPVSDDGQRTVLRLNAAHPVYQLHFPGRPITPGVCLVQMLGELMERKTGLTLELKRIVNLKFVHILSPEESTMLAVAFDSVTTTGEADIHAKGTIAVCSSKGGLQDTNGEVATKFSLIWHTSSQPISPHP